MHVLVTSGFGEQRELSALRREGDALQPESRSLGDPRQAARCQRDARAPRVCATRPNTRVPALPPEDAPEMNEGEKTENYKLYSVFYQNRLTDVT